LENPLSTERGGSLLPHVREDGRYDLQSQGLAASHSCRVLVVDDDALVRARLAAVLNASQYLVEVAATGEEAMRIMEATPCHVVLTDWQMPDMDGLALCRQVRLTMQENYVYVLMLTIRDTEHDVQTALAAGADAYVVKGTPIEEILARVEIGRRISLGESPRETRNRDDPGSSYKDPVTGALSLNYLMYHLPRELIRSQRYGHPLGILSCTIDGFDRFTDRFAREAGDEQLRSFVAAADSCIRRSDWLARMVADSFVVVLPETTRTGAHRAAEKLRARFALHPLSTSAEPIGFTVSIEVIALEGKHNAENAARVDSLLRSANCRTYSRPLTAGEPTNARLMTHAMGPSVHSRGKNGLN
jgi:two-component system cell cycle response regulator